MPYVYHLCFRAADLEPYEILQGQNSTWFPRHYPKKVNYKDQLGTVCFMFQDPLEVFQVSKTKAAAINTKCLQKQVLNVLESSGEFGHSYPDPSYCFLHSQWM